MSRRRLVVTLARRRAHAASPNDRLAYAGVPRDPIICLVGGMGPLASAQIHVALVNAVSALPGVDFDDEHPDVVHASFPRGLYDVSPWILQNGAAIRAAGLQLDTLYVTDPSNSFYLQVHTHHFIATPPHSRPPYPCNLFH